VKKKPSASADGDRLCSSRLPWITSYETT